jgi:hypothetical protein
LDARSTNKYVKVSHAIESILSIFVRVRLEGAGYN